MTLNTDAPAIYVRADEFEPAEQPELEMLWLERLVTAAGTAIAVLFATVTAVVMYLA